MTVISVRLAPDQQEFLRKHKLKPGPFVKELLEREIRYLRFQENLAYLRKHRVKPKPGTPSSTEIIRWDRDHGH